jgi:hypothetical protein
MTGLSLDPRQATRDHLLPKSRGGTLAQWNRVVACRRCNSDKADRTPREFLVWLIERQDRRVVWVQKFIESYDVEAHYAKVEREIAEIDASLGRRLGFEPARSGGGEEVET